MKRARPLIWAAVFFLSFSPARAELADREKPITLSADRMTIDDLKKVQILEGNVVLTQGTLVIRAAKIVVTEDMYGFQHGVAFGGGEKGGGLARFRQKREKSEDWIEGEAERIEYDTHHEVAEFFHRAWIQSGSDELRGDYIWYDGISERYQATSGNNAASGASSPQRVQAVIQPRNKSAKPAAGDVPAPEREADSLGDGGANLKAAPRLTIP
ncbi:MAG: lipopolysaccharide transport periplasmic protein LptA [Zoogloeaceae bacterium]|jgi:lipopolysaccharide export system protein LptA|nr:lipopolysaccharide transport periplasmic protein LptA [Zoogloeaceae bacterium]